MKIPLVYFCFFVALQNSFTTSTPISIDKSNLPVPEVNLNSHKSEPSTTSSTGDTNRSQQSRGRNMEFGDLDEDDFMLTPLRDNYDVLPDNQPPVLVVDPALPYPINFDDRVDNEALTQDPIMIPQPLNENSNPSNDDDEEEDMETAAQIVFRPLFAYRKQTAQRRRVYSKPSSTSSYGNGQRRQQSYSSYGYGYPTYYPRNYNTWC